MADNKNWTTDEKQMKSSGLNRFVQGETLSEKMRAVTRGKRTEYATFQDYIDYASDFITLLLSRLTPEDDRDEELDRLTRIIEELEAKLNKLNREAARLRDEVSNARGSEQEYNAVKDQISRALAEKESLRAYMDKLNEEKSAE